MGCAHVGSSVVLIGPICRTENDCLDYDINLKEARTFRGKASISCLPYLVLSFAVLKIGFIFLVQFYVHSKKYYRVSICPLPYIYTASPTILHPTPEWYIC